MEAVVLTFVTLIVGVIGLQIVNTTITNAAFNASSLLGTVSSNIAPLFAVSLLIVAVMAGLLALRGR